MPLQGKSDLEVPRILILAGPNGAGKSTFAASRFDELVTEGRFLNIDDIAAGRSAAGGGMSAVAAARLGLRQRHQLIEDRQSFAIETTLAGRRIIQLMIEAGQIGYIVDLAFLYMADPLLCHRRVAQRVQLGGHNIPSGTIDRRYDAGLANLPQAWQLAHNAQVFDASADPVLVAEKSGKRFDIYDVDTWRFLMPGV